MSPTIGEGLSEIPEPRGNPDLVGHEAAEGLLVEAMAGGRLGHAWMITGPRGIGKATLAFRLARAALALAPSAGAAPTAPDNLYLAPDHPLFRRVAAGGHADLLTVERSIDEKTKRLRSEIVIADVRRLIAFFGLTAGEGGWRVAVIDSADELNRHAANALLKVLEEPPERSLIVLLAHAPGRVPPTIHSRCRKLKLKPLDEAVVGRLLARYCPDLGEEEREALARLAEGSAGRALMLAAQGGLELYRELLGLLDGLPRLDVPALHSLCERLARPQAEADWRTLTALLELWLARVARAAAGAPGPEAVPGEAASLQRLAKAGDLDQWIEVWDKIVRFVASADSAKLDRKQVLLNAFTSLERVGREETAHGAAPP